MIRIDAQLPPELATWLRTRFGVEARAVRDLGMHRATDLDLFRAAGEAGASLMTKDADFVWILERFGPPPRVLWITCGNTGNEQLRKILEEGFPKAWSLLQADEPARPIWHGVRGQ